LLQVPAVQVAIDHLPDIGPEKPVPTLEALLIDLLEGLKIRYRLAKEIGVSAQRIGDIVAGKRAIFDST
jgi:plasmid maintenance system antidote protein VapI